MVEITKFSELEGKPPFIGVQVVKDAVIYAGNKYAFIDISLDPCPDPLYKKYRFANPYKELPSCWSANWDYVALIHGVLNNPSVKVYLFDSQEEINEWLTSKDK